MHQDQDNRVEYDVEFSMKGNGFWGFDSRHSTPDEAIKAAALQNSVPQMYEFRAVERTTIVRVL
jgi:hypothetical protein